MCSVKSRKNALFHVAPQSQTVVTLLTLTKMSSQFLFKKLNIQFSQQLLMFVFVGQTSAQYRDPVTNVLNHRNVCLSFWWWSTGCAHLKWNVLWLRHWEWTRLSGLILHPPVQNGSGQWWYRWASYPLLSLFSKFPWKGQTEWHESWVELLYWEYFTELV